MSPKNLTSSWVRAASASAITRSLEFKTSTLTVLPASVRKRERVRPSEEWSRRSIKPCLFLINELRGEYQESVTDALVQAQRRGVDVQVIANGHMAREGDPSRAFTMQEELARPLQPAVIKLRRHGIPVGLTYGLTDHRVPYCPLHPKYCVIDDSIVLEGSFNW